MKQFLICVTFLAALCTSKAQTLSSSDSVQIISMIDDWNKAWEIKDYLPAAKWYSSDAVFTNAFGDKRNGQKEIELLLKHVFSLPFVMAGKSQTIEHRFQILDDRNIIVHTTVVRKGQKMPDESVLPDRHTTHLRVFQFNDNTWEIKAHLISDAREKQSPEK